MLQNEPPPPLEQQVKEFEYNSDGELLVQSAAAGAGDFDLTLAQLNASYKYGSPLCHPRLSLTVSRLMSPSDSYFTQRPRADVCYNPAVVLWSSSASQIQ